VDNCEEVIRVYVPRIVSEWRPLTEGSPWTSLTEAERVDHLPPLLRALLRGTLCEPPSDAAREESVRAAVVHGGDRRRQGFTEEQVLQEYYFLRIAVWSVIRGSETHESALQIARADTMLSVLSLASLQGMHREQIQALGRWDDNLGELFGRVRRLS